MNWLIFVAISIIMYSAMLFVDNYVADVYFKGRESTAQKTFYAVFQFLIATTFAIIFGINFTETPPLAAFLFFLSGAIASLSGIFYYRALETDDSTNLSIFAQISPILYLLFGCIFLGQPISPMQLLAFTFILAAPVIIVFTTKKRSRKVRLRAIVYSFLWIAIYVAGNMIFVQQDNKNVTMGSELVFIFLGKSIGNLIIVLAHRKWLRRYKTVLVKSRGKLLIPMILSGTFGAANLFAYYQALTEAPSVALASVTSDSVTPIVIFFFGILLTLINPSFGREKLDRKNVIVHLVATVLVVVGIVLIQK